MSKCVINSVIRCLDITIVFALVIAACCLGVCLMMYEVRRDVRRTGSAPVCVWLWHRWVRTTRDGVRRSVCRRPGCRRQRIEVLR